MIRTIAIRTTAALALLLAGCGSPTKTNPVNGLRVDVAAAAVAGDLVKVTVTATADGAVRSGFAGSLTVTTDDPDATAPARVELSGGTGTIDITFKRAGQHRISVSDGVVTGVGELTIRNAPAARIELSLSADVSAGDAQTLSMTVKDRFGNVASDFTGRVSFTSSDPRAALPADYTFIAGDAGHRAFSFTLGSVGNFTLAVHSAPLADAVAAIAVVAGPADHFTVAGLAPSVAAGSAAVATIEARDRYGNLAARYSGLIHIVLTDFAAPHPGDLAASNGLASLMATLLTVGEHSILLNDVVNPAVRGSATVTVTPSGATQYALSTLSSPAVAGEPLPLALTALDDFGNVDTAYSGMAHFAGGSGDHLPGNTAFNAGRAAVGLSFTRTGGHLVTVSELNGTISRNTNLVTVTSDFAAALDVLPGSSGATAGAPAAFTATIEDRFGNPVPTYSGTVRFSSTDAAFVAPASYTYAAGDAGAHPFSGTFQTAGSQRLDATDGTISGGASWAVGPAAAASCLIDPGQPAPAQVDRSMRLSLSDAFGNRANTYAGTMLVTGSDASIHAPAAGVAFAPDVDHGSKVFAVRFDQAGFKSVTAADASVGVTCSVQVEVSAPAVHYSVVLPSDANYGAPAAATIRVLDAANALIPGYAGTVGFTTSDGAATLPAAFVFDGTQGGTASVTVRFRTLSTQTLTATEQGNAFVTGTGSTQVHGLVYTNPAAGQGVIRLVANAASTPGNVRLDLVVASTVITGGFGVGLNLPADTGRVLPDDAGMLVPGTVLAAGAGVAARAASLTSVGPTANVLFTGVSAKNGATGSGADVAINNGALLYGIRLQLNPAAPTGMVVDGAIAMASYRAALRDRLGNDTVGQSQFAIGRLEVK